ECRKLRLDDPARIAAHMQRYRDNGYPVQNGLYTTRIIARWHDRMNVRKMCEVWWKEYLKGSRRDQLSFNYSIWKSPPIKISVVDYDDQFVKTRNFVVVPHKWPIRLDGVNFTLEPSGPGCVGNIDSADALGIRGWAADRNRLNTSINVSLYNGDTL